MKTCDELVIYPFYLRTFWFSTRIQGINNLLITKILYFFKVTILLELRYRSPLEGNEDSDDGLDDEDDEEFIPNVGLVSLQLREYYKNMEYKLNHRLSKIW